MGWFNCHSHANYLTLTLAFCDYLHLLSKQKIVSSKIWIGIFGKPDWPARVRKSRKDHFAPSNEPVFVSNSFKIRVSLIALLVGCQPEKLKLSLGQLSVSSTRDELYYNSYEYNKLIPIKLIHVPSFFSWIATVR